MRKSSYFLLKLSLFSLNKGNNKITELEKPMSPLKDVNKKGKKNVDKSDNFRY